MRRLALSLMLIFLPVALWAQEEPLSPQEVVMFGRYHVREVFRNKPEMPDMSDSGARMYRTRLRYAAEHGANFAGHYAIALWGCGAGCVSFAAIDLTNGRVTFFPAAVSWADEKNSGVRFRKDSRALHVVGALNEEDPADRWYEWTGRSFRLISRKAAEIEPMPPSDDQ